MTSITGWGGADPSSSRDRFEVVFNASLDGILIVSGEQGVVLSANPAASRLLGWTCDELRGRSYAEIYNPSWDDEKQPGESLLAGFGGDVLEYQRVSTASGAVQHMDMTISMIDWEGEPALLITLRDSESRLMAARAMRQARQEAIEAARLKAAFLANMSHEIRTPLNGIIGMTDLLLDTPLDAQQTEFTQTIRTCGENLLNLINDILDLSKFEAGRVPLESIDFDLTVCLEEALDIVAARAQLKGLEIVLDVDPGLPRFVKGDRTRLQQVMLNLLSNAVKFTEQGQVVLEARTGATRGMQVDVELEVRDTGIGIPAEALERIFQPFQQEDASTTRKYGGTGLGLSITRRIVEAMNGTIRVDSNPGSGSVFVVSLGLTAVEDPGQSATITHQRRGDLRRLMVLLVEPADTTRLVLERQLQVWGCRVISVPDIDEAWRMIRQGRTFHVTLLETASPGFNADKVRECCGLDHACGFGRVVLLSSIPGRRQAEELRSAGVAGVLLKPVRAAVLHDTILAALGRGDAPEKQGTEPGAPPPLDAVPAGRILLVEDDAVNRRVATLLLRKRGLECDVAEDGLQALDACARQHYDVVLMDCQMPRMDGFTATRELRARETPGTHRPTIIAMTANAMEGDRERCIDAGMDDYIKKPVQAKQLYDVLATHLGHRESLKEAAAPPPPAAPPAAAGPWDDEPLFDPQPLESLAELVGGADDSLIRDMVRDFVDGVPDAVRRMREALAADDIETAGGIAHMFESRTGNVGARRVQVLCNQIQTRWKKRQPEGMAALVDALEAAHRDTVPVLLAAHPLE